MSINVSNHVWDLKFGNATRKLVLLRYADHAHADGTAAYCGIPLVADFAECDERTVKRHVKWLVEHGYMREGDQELVAHLPKNKRPVVYDIAMDESTRARWEVYNASGGNSRRESAVAAGQKGAEKRAANQAAKAQVSEGDKMSPQGVASNPVIGGDEMSPQVGGDTRGPGGVTDRPVGGDTGVTQTTLETTLGNRPSSSSEPLRATDPSSDAHREAIAAKRRDRPDVERVCEHLLARLIELEVQPLPKVGVRWLDAARLLMDTDGRTEQQVHNMIEWATNDAFWRANIHSMPTLREKYNTMRLQAMEGVRRPGGRAAAYSDDIWKDRPGGEDMTPEEAAAEFGVPVEQIIAMRNAG